METIILILAYLLSILFCRCVFKKIEFIGGFEALICLFPLLNIISAISVLSIYLIENNDIDYDNISDWFFGKK